MPVTMDSTAFRRLMGNFATGVTVVTSQIDGMYHGMTANAVTSVSLDPLLVLVCVDKRARAHAEIARAGHFGMSMLSARQEDLSNLFASSAPPEQGSLRGVPIRVGKTGVPLIEGAIACLECEIDRLVDAGDHSIFLGRVVDGAVMSEEAPLLYFRGRYARLSD
jgi:flavin reductase (DIM6/NTAB) family NADH-FMN oxidoreductase RutF